MIATATRPAGPIRLYRHPLSGHCHRVELFMSLTGLPFEAIDVEPTRIYRAADAKQFLQEAGLSDATVGQIDGRIMSAFVRARKPAAAVKSCCGPTCCS